MPEEALSQRRFNFAADLEDISHWDCRPYDDSKINDILAVVLPCLNPTYQALLLEELDTWSDGLIEVKFISSNILGYLEMPGLTVVDTE